MFDMSGCGKWEQRWNFKKKSLKFAANSLRGKGMTEVEMASLAGLIFSQCPPTSDFRRILELAAEMCEEYYIRRPALVAAQTANVIRLVTTPLEAQSGA